MLKLIVYYKSVKVKKTFNSYTPALDSYYYYLNICKKHPYYTIYLGDTDTNEILKMNSYNKDR